MAITQRGSAVLRFGTITLSGYVTTDEELSTEGESYQLEDEVGDIITDVSGFGERTNGTFNFIPLTATTNPPAIGAIFTGPGSVKGIVRRVNRIRSRKVPEAWRIEVQSFPGVVLP